MSQSAVADIRQQDFSPFETRDPTFSLFSSLTILPPRDHTSSRGIWTQDATRASFSIGIFLITWNVA